MSPGPYGADRTRLQRSELAIQVLNEVDRGSIAHLKRDQTLLAARDHLAEGDGLAALG